VQHHLTGPDLLEHRDGFLMTEPMQGSAIHSQNLVTYNRHTLHATTNAQLSNIFNIISFTTPNISPVCIYACCSWSA
jgi:hypothetical protein